MELAMKKNTILSVFDENATKLEFIGWLVLSKSVRNPKREMRYRLRASHLRRLLNVNQTNRQERSRIKYIQNQVMLISLHMFTINLDPSPRIDIEINIPTTKIQKGCSMSKSV